MPRGKAIDLDTLTPEERERVLKKRAAARARYYRNRERCNETARRWSDANRERVREMQRQWTAANRERKAATTRRWQQKAVETMSDSYVRTNFAKKLSGLQAKDVPDEILASARQLMLINRQLRKGPTP